MIHRMHSEDSNIESDTRSSDGHGPSSGGRRSDGGAAFDGDDGVADSEDAEPDAVGDDWGLAVDVGAEEEVMVEEGDDVRDAADELAPDVVSRMRLLAVGATSAFAAGRRYCQIDHRNYDSIHGALTLEVPARTLGVVDRIIKEVVCVLRDERDEANPGWVDGRVREVAVVEDDHVALQERVAEVPAEQRAAARGVRAHDVVRDARLGVALLVLRDEVAWVDGEHLAADLEGEAVGGIARQRRVRV